MCISNGSAALRATLAAKAMYACTHYRSRWAASAASAAATARTRPVRTGGQDLLSLYDMTPETKPTSAAYCIWCETGSCGGESRRCRSLRFSSMVEGRRARISRLVLFRFPLHLFPYPNPFYSRYTTPLGLRARAEQPLHMHGSNLVRLPRSRHRTVAYPTMGQRPEGNALTYIFKLHS
jgi:hypothetical protein